MYQQHRQQSRAERRQEQLRERAVQRQQEMGRRVSRRRRAKENAAAAGWAIIDNQDAITAAEAAKELGLVTPEFQQAYADALAFNQMLVDNHHMTLAAITVNVRPLDQALLVVRPLDTTMTPVALARFRTLKE